MKTNIYSVYDSKAEAHMEPFFAKTNALAIRKFEQHVNNPETIWAKYPSDFTLFHIGTFEEDTAKLIPEKTPISLGLAIEFVQAQPDPQQMELVK